VFTKPCSWPTLLTSLHSMWDTLRWLSHLCLGPWTVCSCYLIFLQCATITLPSESTNCKIPPLGTVSILLSATPPWFKSFLLQTWVRYLKVIIKYTTLGPQKINMSFWSTNTLMWLDFYITLHEFQNLESNYIKQIHFNNNHANLVVIKVSFSIPCCII